MNTVISTSAVAPRTLPADTAGRTLPADGSEPLGFAALGVAAPLVEVLAALGAIEPFPIQTATLPDSLAGRDVLGRGKTGSGKTIAFAVPLVTALARPSGRRQPHSPRALVLVPTRELATQVARVVEPLAAAVGLRTTTIFGGVGQRPQVNALRTGVDIVVACPGRLEDLIGQGFCRLDQVEVTVLDEADHMADLGFLPGVKRLMDRTPTDGQRMLFSATLDNGVDVLVKRYLTHPVTHSVDPPAMAPSSMAHYVFTVAPGDKFGVVRDIAAAYERTLMFTRTKHGAKKLAKQLNAAGINAGELHGNLAQGARERNLAGFAAGEMRVLVATDIAARGIHVDDIGLVVHVDLPAEHKAYLHRSGRTARAGNDGVVVTIATTDQGKDMRALVKAAGIRPTTLDVAPGSAVIGDLPVPEGEPRVTPRPVRAARPESSPDHRREGRRDGRPQARDGRPGAPASRNRRRGRPAR